MAGSLGTPRDLVAGSLGRTQALDIGNDPDPETNDTRANNKPEDESNGVAEKQSLTNNSNSNDPDPEINVSTVNNNPEDESNIVTEKPVESTANEIKTERNNCKRKGPGLAKC